MKQKKCERCGRQFIGVGPLKIHLAAHYRRENPPVLQPGNSMERLMNEAGFFKVVGTAYSGWAKYIVK